jgi:hypothetical protein
MKRLMLVLILFWFVIAAGNVAAQNFQESLRLSQINPHGTAAFMGTGGAATALGGDFTLLSINPAGLGEYKSNMFIFTPSFRGNRSQSFLANDPNSRTREELKNGLGLENIGFVISKESANPKWSRINYGFGINQLNNFNQRIFYDGISAGTILDRWTGLAVGIPPDNLGSAGEADLAYGAGAIYNFNPQTGLYSTDFDGYEGPVKRSHDIERTGRNNEMVFSIAGNYNEKWNLGLTLGVPFFRFEENVFYREVDPNVSNRPGGDIDFFNALRRDESLTTRGYGFNLKGGAIYKLSQFTRLGLSVSTPTLMRLTDEYSTLVGYDFTDANQSGELTDRIRGEFEYRYATPWTLNIGFAQVFRSGFISLSMLYMDYSAARYNFTAFSNNPIDRDNQELVNDDIRFNLGRAVSTHLGGEYNFQPVRLRGGLRLLQSPLQNDDSVRPVFSTGIGFRSGNFILDIGYSYSFENLNVLPYEVLGAPQPQGNVKFNRSVFAITFAFRG